MDDNHKLKWRFDVSTFRLIGRDLITDRVTALFELVKNCYDANAQNVNVWGIERSGFFNGREKWAKGFENQRV